MMCLVRPLSHRRRLNRSLARLAPLLCSLTLSAGCGRSGPATVPVSGSVTFSGQPVAEGEIQFRSADGAAASWAGPITGGRYEIRSTVGPKRVEIIATRPKAGAKPKPSGEDVVNEMYIPDRYNLESELTAEVTEAGPNTFDFRLE
jgi:hypothetical protein